MRKRHRYILVIDDSATIRAIVGNMLSKHQHQVLMAESVELALNDFEWMQFDMVITDIFMPGVGGIKGIARIREKWPDIKVIAISGGFKGGHKESALEAARRIGADLALGKPFSEEELMAGVDNLFAKQANPPQLASP